MPRRKKPHHKTTTEPRIIELEINEVGRGGAGVGQDADGRAVFVPFTAADDVVKVRIKNSKLRYSEAELVEIISPSSQRQQPPCEVFTQCGGCQWQHLPYELQWQVKCSGLTESLRRAGVTFKKKWDMYPAQQIWEYRNRIQLRRKGAQIGFYSNHSHQLIPIQKCMIARSEINRSIAVINQEISDSENGYKNNGKIELAIDTQGRVQQLLDSQHADTGFKQVNDEQNNNLQAWIKQQSVNVDGVFDLYGGSGNLSIGMADTVMQIHCVDTHIARTQEAYPNNISFHEIAVTSWLESRFEKNKYARKNSTGPKTWMALIDPPRSGLDKDGDKIIKFLTALKVSRVVLVGCKSDPWSRDVAKFISQGWKLDKVAIFDFFPQTYHVESAATLTRV